MLHVGWNVCRCRWTFGNRDFREETGGRSGATALDEPTVIDDQDGAVRCFYLDQTSS